MDKAVNYTPAQEALIVAAIEANDGVANKTVAETLASNPAMNSNGEPRKVRSIIAKMRRVVDANESFSYERQAPQTKDGKPVNKKADLVAAIVERSGLTAKALAGLENAPKLALETLAGAFPLTGTEG